MKALLLGEVEPPIDEVAAARCTPVVYDCLSHVERGAQTLRDLVWLRELIERDRTANSMTLESFSKWLCHLPERLRTSGSECHVEVSLPHSLVRIPRAVMRLPAAVGHFALIHTKSTLPSENPSLTMSLSVNSESSVVLRWSTDCGSWHRAFREDGLKEILRERRSEGYRVLLAALCAERLGGRWEIGDDSEPWVALCFPPRP